MAKFPMTLEVNEPITQITQQGLKPAEGIVIVGSRGIGVGDLYINGKYIGQSMAVRQDMPELYYTNDLMPTDTIGSRRSVIEGYLEA